MDTFIYRNISYRNFIQYGEQCIFFCVAFDAVGQQIVHVAKNWIFSIVFQEKWAGIFLGKSLQMLRTAKEQTTKFVFIRQHNRTFGKQKPF